MRWSFTSGCVGALGEKSPGATRALSGLSAIAMCRLLAEGEYSLPIAVGDSDAGAQHRGHL